MNDDKKKLEVSIEEDDAGIGIRVTRQSALTYVPPSCSKGYAVYQFEQGKLFRVGSGACTSSVLGSSNNWPSAHSSITIGSALTYQIEGIMAGHSEFKEMRFVLCCGPSMISHIPGIV